MYHKLDSMTLAGVLRGEMDESPDYEENTLSNMRIVSLATSKKKGTPKVPVDHVCLVEEHGIEGDAHAGPGIGR